MLSTVVCSTFNAASTRYVTTDDKKLVASIDVYDGDFHTVTVTPDRYSLPENIFLLDPEYAKLSELRAASTKDLAVTGDSMRKEIVWEFLNPERPAGFEDVIPVVMWAQRYPEGQLEFLD